MKVTVNHIPLDLHSGARVKDAILKYYTELGIHSPNPFPKVEDRYGNKVASDGELSDGNILFIRTHRKMTSSIPKLVLAALVIVSLFGCSVGEKDNISGKGQKQAILFAVNDMHAEIDNFPKLAYIVDSLQSIYPGMLLISAGDNQTGNPVNDQYPQKGLPMIELMNAVGFDLSAVGNHEFDTHPQGFSDLTHKADFDFICAKGEPL